MTRKLFSIFSILFLFSLAVSSEDISFHASSMSGRTGGKNSTDITSLEGNASVETASMKLSADKIELSGEDFRYVKASGNIKGEYSRSNLNFECSELKYDRQIETVTLSGDVNLTDTEHDVKAFAQIIEYDSETDIATLQIEVKLTQKNNICSSAYALYRKKDQKLELSGSAKVINGDDTFRAQTISFDMDTEEIKMDGNVRGSVKDNSGEKK